MKKYNHSVLGGTFDNFHKGHKFLIKKAFEKSNKVTIGLTSTNFVKEKISQNSIQKFKDRKQNLLNFLEKQGFIKNSKIIEISDIYGITLKEKNIDAIFVTDDTIKNAEKINRNRKKNNLPLLKIEKVNLIKDSLQKTISSTNIRSGEIDDLGNYYKTIFEKTNEFKLLEKFRLDFKKPIGKIVKNISKKDFKDKFIIAVGDIAVSKLVENNLRPNIGIYDLHTKRTKVTENVLSFLPEPNKTLTNNQGSINSKTAISLYNLIQKSKTYKKSYFIKINGEEDLLAIPAILLSPIGSIVFYGQRNVGGIIVNVTLEKKKEIEKNFLKSFQKLHIN